MKFKEGVDSRGVHPRLWYVLSWLDRLHYLYTNEELTVTSMRRPFRIGVVTKHAAMPPPRIELNPFIDERKWGTYFVTAADTRRWALDKGRIAETFCRHVQEEHGDELGVVLEPDWLTAEEIDRRGGLDKIDPHIHWQLKEPIQWSLWK